MPSASGVPGPVGAGQGKSHPGPVRHLLVAPDKFRGTASAGALVRATMPVAEAAGWAAEGQPLSDGGEGLLEALGGEIQADWVTGPLGAPVQAKWALRADLEPVTAVIEMAQASGLTLAGGPSGNDPMAATTRGTGELVRRAVAAGARRVVLGCGGSATTDGGLGAVEAIGGQEGLQGAELVVACDVSTLFVDAARVFGPQKGAGPRQVEQLSRRLEELAEKYRARFGVDVRHLPGSGSAGGLGGGLAALGAQLLVGIEMVARLVNLDQKVAGADLVVTGEGALDSTSMHGKTVTGVLRRLAAGQRCLIVVGRREPCLGHRELARATGTRAQDLEIASLSERFGLEASMNDTAGLFASVVGEILQR